MQLKNSWGFVLHISYGSRPTATSPTSQRDKVCPESAAAQAALGAVSCPCRKVMGHSNVLSARHLSPRAGQVPHCPTCENYGAMKSHHRVEGQWGEGEVGGSTLELIIWHLGFWMFSNYLFIYSFPSYLKPDAISSNAYVI